MNLCLDSSLIQGYTSQSQAARVLTEDWVLRNSYCPNCGNNPLQNFENNRPVADFGCLKCSEEYELKSKRGDFHANVVDGAYSTMLQRISSGNNPNFFFMSYTQAWAVKSFFVVPKQFFTPDVIVGRKPLSAMAKRAGWVGCNINLSAIAEAGKVFLVKNSIVAPVASVKASFARVRFLREANSEAKGWLLDVLKCVELFPTTMFSLEDVYAFEHSLGSKYPRNRFVRAKIRQQLQVLRDNGLLEFVAKGRYKKSA